MKETIKNKCDLLTENREKLAKQFKWNFSLMNLSAALVFTGEGKEPDADRLDECVKLLKKNASAFSSLRSQMEPIVASKMALAADPQQYISDLKIIYDKVTKGSFFESAYMVQAAISILDAGKIAEADEIIARYKELYKKMSKEHPILTSSEDIVFSVLLVMTEKDVDTIVEEMETCYDYLKKEKKIKVGGNEIQGLGEILALSDGDMIEKCDRVVKLYNTFAEHGAKYGRDYGEFASLGALVGIDADADALVDEIIETAEYLKSSKGFGGLSMDKKQRLMFAAMLVGDAYSGDNTLSSSSLINSTVAMVIAEEVAIMVCIMAATTSATTNS